MGPPQISATAGNEHEIDLTQGSSESERAAPLPPVLDTAGSRRVIDIATQPTPAPPSPAEDAQTEARFIQQEILAYQSPGGHGKKKEVSKGHTGKGAHMLEFSEQGEVVAR